MLNRRTHYFPTGGFTLANIQTKHRYNKSVICESPRSRARYGEVRGKRWRLTARVWVGGWVSELTEQSKGVLQGRFSLLLKECMQFKINHYSAIFLISSLILLLCVRVTV